MMSVIFPRSILSFFFLDRRKGSIATAESVIGAALGEETPSIAWVRRHHDSEDERVGVGMVSDGMVERSSCWQLRHAPKQ